MTTKIEPTFDCHLNVKERCWEGFLANHTHELSRRLDIAEAERMFYRPPAPLESAADALAAYKMNVRAFMEKKMRREWAEAETRKETT